VASTVGWELVPSPNSIARRLQTKKYALVEQHNNFSYFNYNFVFSPSSHSSRTVLQ
jgi:hypothetical protein